MLYEAKRHRWNPGVYDLLEQDFTKQLDAWGERMLNSDSRISTLGDASISEPTFIRPLNDSKHFTGKLFEVGEFHQLQEKAIRNDDNNGRGLSLKTPLQLSGPKHILSEARVWVVDGNIVTQSIYKRGQTVFYSAEVDPDLIKVAQTAIDDWQPHKAFVIDVCDTDKGAKIVEINAINSAGFYAGDVQKIVMALEQMEGAF